MAKEDGDWKVSCCVPGQTGRLTDHDEEKTVTATDPTAAVRWGADSETGVLTDVLLAAARQLPVAADELGLQGDARLRGRRSTAT